MKKTQESTTDPVIDAMFDVGAHYGYPRSRRHPTVKPYIFGVKNKVDIFDLEKSRDLLQEAKEFARSLGKQGKQIVFVTGKQEALPAIRKAATELAMPVVAGRWVGGTFTNFQVIRARIDKLLELREAREKGELAERYTKRERLMIDREIDRLEHLFSGLTELKGMPGALFVVDPGREHIAVEEARKRSIPVIAIAGSDCDLADIDYPIVGNDSSAQSIAYFVQAFVSAYRDGRSA